MREAALVLGDGTVYEGRGMGALGASTGEARFTTARAAYDEAVIDPSYTAQVLGFSYPLSSY
jgi:carbamoyl-phosphate synthase small subunit